MRTHAVLLGLSLSLVGCPLGAGADDTGLDCRDSSDCDDPNDALACVSTNDDEALIDVGGAAGNFGVCLPPPQGWSCRGDFWNDKDSICDCGCGLVDADCAGNELATACSADGNNCPAGQSPVADDNSQCA